MTAYLHTKGKEKCPTDPTAVAEWEKKQDKAAGELFLLKPATKWVAKRQLKCQEYM